MTVPDQTMSIKEILDRYARGLNPNSAKVPLYQSDIDEDENLDHIQGIKMETLDISEKADMAKQAKATVDAVKEAAKKRKDKEALAQHEKNIREKVAKELAEKQAQQKPDSQ